jgi:hypothetical protein
VIPGNTLSVSPVSGDFLFPDSAMPRVMYVSGIPRDEEMGGVALNNPTLGLMYQRWTFYFDLATGHVNVRPDAGTVTTLFTDAALTELSGSFDSNMNTAVAYMSGGACKLHWYDSTVPGYVTTTFDGCSSPRLTLDDKRPLHDADRDILFFYLRAGALYYRQQRDRYGTERWLYDVPAGLHRIGRVGMANSNRVQIEIIV